MPAETAAFGSFSQAAAAQADQTRPGLCFCCCCCCRCRCCDPLREDGTRLKAVKVTGRCLIVSEDNLMFLPNVCSLSCCAHTPLLSLSRARCTTTPTTGSALQKGPVQGVLPPTSTELQRHHGYRREPHREL